jgi:hypothetical protein
VVPVIEFLDLLLRTIDGALVALILILPFILDWET